MAPRRTDREVSRLREIARAQSTSPPLGYERYNINWSRLSPSMRIVVCVFADKLREFREDELELLRLGTVDHIKALSVELGRLVADTRR